MKIQALAVLLSTLPLAAGDKPAAGASAPVAVVDGVVISAQDLDEHAAAQLAQLRNQEYAIRERALDEMIGAELLRRAAASRKLDVEELLKAEVDARLAAATPEEVQAAYERVKGRLGNVSEDEGRKRVADGLAQQRREERRVAFLKELRSRASVSVLLEPIRQSVDAALAPVRGPLDAPVTIVEFSDFQCPFCVRVTPTLLKLRESYGDKIRLAYRHFPLPMHPLAPKAAEAAACAGEQGKFWEMHDRLFAANGKLQIADLKAQASELGLDGEAFGACLDGGKLAALVKADMEAGQRYGVSGTPAFFVNGRFISGAQPYEAFARVIDDELARSAAKPAAAPQR
jgi:protein-disulfide isomerase